MPPDRPETQKGQPPIAEAALFGLCPHCGAKTLFTGMARFAPKCSACDLDFSRFNVGDGPAAFLTLIVGTVVTILAIWVQLRFEPAFWVHAVLWIPLAAIMTLGGLRIAKAALVASEYRNSARETGSREL